MYFKGALFLHTLRSVVDDDGLWWSAVRDFYQHFKYRNILTEDVVGFFTARLERDVSPIFDQYLRRAEIPTLELAFAADGTLAYRWRAGERRFAMPIRVRAGGRWSTLEATTDWKTMPSPAPMDSLEVPVDLYYVKVEKRAVN
jgi:aminopeptidase N